MIGNWKVPEVEGLNRTFNEGTRYYNLPYQRVHGLKRVAPPVAENVQSLVEEAKLYEMRNKFDSLSSKQQQSVQDMLSQKSEKRLDLSAVKSQSSSAMKARQKFGFGHKRHKTMFSKPSDEVQSKAASRILNISGSKMGNFAFPKRERFNEEIASEIQE